MPTRYYSLLIYILKCLTGIVLSYIISSLTGLIDYTWCLISVILVLSPEGNDAMKLAINRIKANFVGAGVGILFLLIQLPGPYDLLAGTVLALFLCDVFKLNDAAKSTLAALAIILLYPSGESLLDTAWQRVSAVIAGCLIGLIVTYIYHRLFKIKVETVPGSITEKEV